MGPPSKAIVKRMAIEKNVNLNVVPLSMLYKAVKDEYEHRDLVHDNPVIAFQIVLDHLSEHGPLYYEALFAMIKNLKRLNQGKRIQIFNH